MSRSRTDAYLIANRYATAAFALADEAGALDAVAADLATLALAMESDLGVKRLIAHPIMSRTLKAKALVALLTSKKAHALAISTVSVLANAGRVSIVGDVSRAFAAKLATSRGIIEAVVISARPLDAATIKSVSGAIAKATGKEPALVQKIDASVIGGIKLRLGSKELDMTIAGALNRTQRALLSVA